MLKKSLIILGEVYLGLTAYIYAKIINKQAICYFDLILYSDGIYFINGKQVRSVIV